MPDQSMAPKESYRWHQHLLQELHPDKPVSIRLDYVLNQLRNPEVRACRWRSSLLTDRMRVLRQMLPDLEITGSSLTSNCRRLAIEVKNNNSKTLKEVTLCLIPFTKTGDRIWNKRGELFIYVWKRVNLSKASAGRIEAQLNGYPEDVTAKPSLVAGLFADGSTWVPWWKQQPGYLKTN